MMRANALAAALLTLTGCAAGSGTTQTAVAPVSTRATEQVTLAVPGGTLYGTLEIPAGSQPHTVALIIAGSGPTDRNGNSPALPGANNSLKMVAESLATEGIASLRYDKRAIAASVFPGLREETLRFTTYSDDAALWVEQLRSDPRFGSVAIIGHSEGALLGTLAAQKADVDALVLVAGAGRPVGDILREQLRAGLPATMVPAADSIIRELEAGRTVADIPPMLASVFRPSVQPYMISWLPLDPVAEVARANVPTLVLQGTTDIQVSSEDAEVLATAGPQVRMVMIDGMNHVLKLASGTAMEQLPSYGDPTLPLAPGLISEIVAFIGMHASPSPDPASAAAR